jgi:hypothetical protein
MKFNLEELAQFLVKAKTSTYVAGGKEVPPLRPGFKELEFQEGDWYYRDSYAGFFQAPGQEVVYFKGHPVWIMSYCGGMNQSYHNNIDFATETFRFLKAALKRVDVSRPFRGPRSFKQGDFDYIDESKGDMTLFSGIEKILFRGHEVFRQHYHGGLIVTK